MIGAINNASAILYFSATGRRLKMAPMDHDEQRLQSNSYQGPLRGIRVVDLTTVVMGPYASQTLAEYGAEVIKVEAPGGDGTRQIGPAREDGMAALFLGINRNKRSVVLDLKTPEGRADLLRLAAGADVFMHNMRPEKLCALGLGPEAIHQVNRRMVFAALTGFGTGGRYAGQPAYDDVIQGLSGLASMMEMQSGTPRYLPTTVADKVGSLTAVGAILAALLQQRATGKGAVVEVPMFESVVSFGLVEHSQGDLFDPPLAPPGYRRALMPARRPHATRDGFACTMPYSDAHWNSLLRELGDAEALNDDRFSSLAQRTRHIELLYERLAEHVKSRTTDEWLALCRRLDIPAARMNRLGELRSDPHLRDVGHFVELHDPEMGCVVFPRNPVSFDGWKSPVRVPPRLGADTDHVMGQARREAAQ
ncbi:CoA transferase [Ramlibacter sp. AN1015]|uniref:CaiB/BaiF CoA transferase family protein n=1 Tax=Ramlibacter sp. AN1015 TaxID=3133428 RepID=UPI0030C3CCDA